MDIEQRLRSELVRSGRNSSVTAAPSVAELAAVASDRRRRNRVLGASGAVVVFAAVLFGSFFAAQAPQSSLEVADGGTDLPQAEVVEEAAASTESQTAPAEEESDDEIVVQDAATQGAPATADAEVEESDADQSAVATDQDEPVDSAGPSEPVEEVASEVEDIAVLAGVTRSLQADPGAATVQTRPSAVALASGSGVLVVADGNGYGGLATRFGSATTTIGLASNNGLDWTEVQLSGIPTGATPAALTEHQGTFVALFESFDADSQTRSTFVGTSTDLASWDVSPRLQGEPFATGLAVGPAGVIVLGDNSVPDVWVGPIGGPYRRTARLAATAVNGVTTLGNEFLVAGRSNEGATLFRSSDGVEWTGTALTAPNAPGATPTVSVDGGAIILSNADGAGNVSLISTDGGVTWNQLNADSQNVSVSSSTLGFLGFSDGGAAVTIADDNTFAGARIEVNAPDRLSLIAAGDDEIVLLQSTESGANWIVASR